MRVWITFHAGHRLVLLNLPPASGGGDIWSQSWPGVEVVGIGNLWPAVSLRLLITP